MAKFYFHLRNHTDQLLDPEGLGCPDLNAIRNRTMRTARDIIAGDAKIGAIDMTYRIDVEDAAAHIVHSLEFEDAVTIKRAA